jgi:DNA-binding FadR family transcriptional regulator
MVNRQLPRNGRMLDPDLASVLSQPIFRPLKAAETVARDIARDIIAGALVTGDPLPNEASMIEQYAVSRESLREGLRLLETQGLIRIRRGPGGGPQVGTVDPSNLGRVSSLYFHMAEATYAELLDAWLFAESEIAERAARNPDAERRREFMEPYLTEHSDEHAGSQTPEVGDFFALHAGFHVKLGMLVDNKVLELTLRTYGSIVSHHTFSVDDPRRLDRVLVEDHRAIAAAVLAGHARRARAEMAEHIKTVAADIREHLGERIHDYVEWR